jgi:hypothetical protein
MRLARVISYIGLTLSLFISAVWYGYYFYWVILKKWEEGVGILAIVSKINIFQIIMLSYPALLLIFFGTLIFAGANGRLTNKWSLFAFILILIGFFNFSLSWFIIGIGHAITGLAVGLLPCLIVSILLVCISFIESPINRRGMD